MSGAALGPGTWKKKSISRTTRSIPGAVTCGNKIPSQTGSVPLQGEEQLENTAQFIRNKSLDAQPANGGLVVGFLCLKHPQSLKNLSFFWREKQELYLISSFWTIEEDFQCKAFLGGFFHADSGITATKSFSQQGDAKETPEVIHL